MEGGNENCVHEIQHEIQLPSLEVAVNEFLKRGGVRRRS